MVSGSNTVRAYITPTWSKRPFVGSNPCSSALTPKVSAPPFLGVALETPLRPGPFVDTNAVVPSESQRGCAGQARCGGRPAEEQRATIEILKPWILHFAEAS